MGGVLPVFKQREIIKILNKLGFVMTRQKGSHMQFKHPDGRATTVPNHSGRDIYPPLTRQICKDINVSVENFVNTGKKQ